MRIAAVLAMGLLASSPMMLDAFERPPAQYDHPYPGRVVINDNYGGELTAWDGPCFPYLGSYACAAVVNGDCHIWAMRGKLTADGRRHEEAHCNGWRH